MMVFRDMGDRLSREGGVGTRGLETGAFGKSGGIGCEVLSENRQRDEACRLTRWTRDGAKHF